MEYKYYNPNPKVRYRKDGTPMKWHIGDCTTRALCKALDLEWKEAFKLQCDEAMKRCDETDSKAVYSAVLLNNGFKQGEVSKEYIQQNHCRPTVRELVDDFYKGEGQHKVVIKSTHHLVAAEGDTLYDTWNSGDETAWSFWYK